MLKEQEYITLLANENEKPSNINARGSFMKPLEINGRQIVIVESYTPESIEAINKGYGTQLEWGCYSWEHNEGAKCIKQGPIFNNYQDALQNAINYVSELDKCGRVA